MRANKNGLYGRRSGGAGSAAPSLNAPSLSWRMPLSAGYDSAGTLTAALGSSSTDKSLPYASVAASGTSSITVTSGAVTNGSPNITVVATAHGLSVGDYVRIAGSTATPANGANGLFNVATVPDANTFTIVTANNFTATSASIGGTYSKCTGTAREFAFNFSSAVAGFLYYIVRSQAFTLQTWESSNSVDGSSGSGSWVRVPHTIWNTTGVPANTGRETNSSEAGGVQAMTASTGWKAIRFTNYDNTASADVLMGAFKCRSATITPDLCLNNGSSLISQDVLPRVMRQKIQLKNPLRDPIYIKNGIPGGKVSDFHGLMTSIIATWGVQPGYVLTQIGPNNVAQGRPYATDANKTRISSAMTTHVDYIGTTWPGTAIFVANCGHINAASPNVNDLANTENGVEPYNDNDVNPYINANLAPANFNDTYQRPTLDEQLALSLFTPSVFFLDSTTHPNAFNYQYIHNWYQKIDDAFFGSAPTAYVADILAAAVAAGGAVPSWYKTRLTTIGGYLTGAVSSITSAWSALSTTYVEAPGTKPTDGGRSTTVLCWMDTAKFDNITLVGGTGKISDMVERSANAGTFTQSTTTIQPAYHPPNPDNNYGMVAAVNAGSMPCNNSGGGATIISGLDAVSQNFHICLAIRGFGGIATGAFFGWGVSTTATKLGLQVSGADDLGQAGGGRLTVIAATAGQPNGTTVMTAPNDYTGWFNTGRTVVLSLVYDGTTLYLRKNGVQIVSAAWAKPAWTADRFYLYGNAASTSRMSAKQGDFICATGYNLTDLARDEAYLTAKFGAA